MSSSNHDRPFQFRLWHLLLAMSLFGLFLAVTVPIWRDARRAVQRLHCGSNLHQIQAALHNYHDRWKTLPPVAWTDSNGKPMHSWRVLVAPLLDSGGAVKGYDFSEPWDGPTNRRFHAVDAELWRCPSNRTKLGRTSYVAIYGPGTAWNINRPTSFDEMTDGISSTLLIVEIRNSDIHWMEPRDISIANLKLQVNAKDDPCIGSYHLGGAMVAFADGRVEQLDEKETAERIKAMLTIAGGEELEDDAGSGSVTE